MRYQKRKRNTPIVTLIRNYEDKKSGKVSVSREKIKWRFDHLDWKDQKKILFAFMDSGISDREWAYSKMLDNWDDSFSRRSENFGKLTMSISVRGLLSDTSHWNTSRSISVSLQMNATTTSSACVWPRTRTMS